MALGKFKEWLKSDNDTDVVGTEDEYYAISEADALKLTSPVLNEISTFLKLKSFGISISPVLSSMRSEVYSVLGR